MINLKGVVQGISMFSTKKGPGLELKISLDKTERSPAVIVTAIAYSKMVGLLKDYNKGSTINVIAEPRNGESESTVYFLITFVNRPPQLN
jgi:hypothetical protein